MSTVAAVPDEQALGVPESMRAVRYHRHGGPEVLVVDEVPVPEAGPFDNHGGHELLDFSMEVLDLSGRYVLISAEATTFGNSLAVDPLRLIGKHISLRVCRSATRRDQETVVRLAEKGKISMPVAEVVPLAEVARAHELQERSAHVGKILVTL